MKLAEIRKNRILSTLIKNDFTLFGSIVRKLVLENMTIDTVQRQEKTVQVNVFGNYFFRDIVERDFDKYIVNICEIASHPSSQRARHFSIVRYTLVYSQVKYSVQVYYILSNHFQLNCINDLHILFDVDTVYLDRTKVGFLPVLNLHKTKPFPLADILHNIAEKKFKLLINNNYITTSELTRIFKLGTLGWHNMEKKTTTVSSLSFSEQQKWLREKCAICHSPHQTSSVVLPCKHCFHFECVMKCVQVFVEDRAVDKVFKCPYCVRELQIKDIV